MILEKEDYLKSKKKNINLFLALHTYFLFFTLVLISGCGQQSRTEKKLQQDLAASSDIEPGLVFNNVTLDQADEQGRPLWRIKAKSAKYSQDKKIARIDKPTGDLFQDGKKVLEISAETGEVEKTGQKVFLRGKIVATDIRNGMALRGNELEWIPKESLLIVRNNLTGTHQKMQVSAQKALYFSRAQQMELVGQIVGISQEPAMQMKTEHLIWRIATQKLVGDKPIEIQQYKDNKITGKANAVKSEINLKTNTAILWDTFQIKSITPPVQINGSSANWNLDTKFIIADQPVRIFHELQQVTVTANRGKVNLENQVAYLTKGVQAVGSKNQSQLNSNQLTWYIATEEFQADGSVFYRQANPPLNLNGSKAIGKLQGQNIVVSGNPGTRVVTEIIP